MRPPVSMRLLRFPGEIYSKGDELSPAQKLTQCWRILGNQTDGVVPLGKSDSAFRTRSTADNFSHTDRRRGSRIARREL